MLFKSFLGRIFLDSSTLQTLQDYGQLIYDGEEIPPSDKLWDIPNGIKNVMALQKIMYVGARGTFQFALSLNSLQEVFDRGNPSYLRWAFEMEDYWEGCLVSFGKREAAFTGQGVELVTKVLEGKFGYLSKKDLFLIKDAVRLECDVFLTMENKLPKNADHLEEELIIKVMQPARYWETIKPWTTLIR